MVRWSSRGGDDFDARDLSDDFEARDLSDEGQEPAQELLQEREGGAVVPLRPQQPQHAAPQFPLLAQALREAASGVSAVSLGALTPGMLRAGVELVVIVGKDGKRRVLR